MKVTIGSDKAIPLSGFRDESNETRAWEPLFAER